MRPGIHVSVLFLLVLAVTCAAPAASSAPAAGATPASPFIQHDDASLRAWVEDYEQAPAAPSAPLSRARSAVPPSEARSLLPFFEHDATEWDQGAVGTCWVFAGTGTLEAALMTSTGVRDRLSVQWFDSNYNGGSGPNWAGNGGTLTQFVRFYDQRRMAVPWSNANASYRDRYAVTSAMVPASAIAEVPNYTILSIGEYRLETRGVGQAQAIATIKGSIDAGRPLFVGLSFPNQAATKAFTDFWWYGGDDEVWNPTPYDYAAWDRGVSHAVLCIGYDRTDPENPYWLMLNSMGTGYAPDGTVGQRPEGTFRMRMDLDYDAIFVHDYAIYPAQWEAVQASFAIPAPTTAPVIPLPGQQDAPRDLDGDGVHEDTNANGRADFADVVLYFNQMTWIAANEPIASFDCNGNGRIDFADVVALFNAL